MDVFKTAQKVEIHLGCFCKKICHQELSKIAQSGHTGGNRRTKFGEKFMPDTKTGRYSFEFLNGHFLKFPHNRICTERVN